jgi:hypothetical protein
MDQYSPPVEQLVAVELCAVSVKSPNEAYFPFTDQEIEFMLTRLLEDPELPWLAVLDLKHRPLGPRAHRRPSTRTRANG